MVLVFGAGVMKALQCPFLTRIPVGQVRQQACELLQMADHCPIMGHVIKYTSVANEGMGKSGHVLAVPKGVYNEGLLVHSQSLVHLKGWNQ
jgi:predicted Co/Zn/Cd cation transporter (cation efflux family)